MEEEYTKEEIMEEEYIKEHIMEEEYIKEDIIEEYIKEEIMDYQDNTDPFDQIIDNVPDLKPDPWYSDQFTEPILNVQQSGSSDANLTLGSLILNHTQSDSEFIYDSRLIVKNELESIDSNVDSKSLIGKAEHENNYSVTMNSTIQSSIKEVATSNRCDALFRISKTPSGGFMCCICNSLFASQDHLLTHLSDHSDNEPFSCELCSKSFKFMSELKNHSVIHTDDKPFSCNICSKSFKRKYELKKHSDKPKFSCNVCSIFFCSEQSLQSHLLTHCKDEPFKCDICSRSLTSNDNLKNHMLIHIQIPSHNCDLCKRPFSSQNQLDRHLRKDHKYKPFCCNVCSKSFVSNRSLKSHLLIHSSTDKESTDKIICFYSRTNEQSTDEKSTDEKSTDEKSTDEKSTAKKRTDKKSTAKKRTDEKSTDEKSTAEKSIGLKNKKKRNIKKEIAFTCDICFASFIYKARYNAHMIKHQEKKPFCKVCGKFFHAKNQLKRHIKINKHW